MITPRRLQSMRGTYAALDGLQVLTGFPMQGQIHIIHLNLILPLCLHYMWERYHLNVFVKLPSKTISESKSKSEGWLRQPSDSGKKKKLYHFDLNQCQRWWKGSRRRSANSRDTSLWQCESLVGFNKNQGFITVTWEVHERIFAAVGLGDGPFELIKDVVELRRALQRPVLGHAEALFQAMELPLVCRQLLCEENKKQDASAGSTKSFRKLK